MSEEGGGLPVVRVKFTCANAEEFRRKFEANLVAKGMLARTPQMHEVGRRVLLRLELQDGSLGVDEEALVQALEWTGGKQAMRLQLLRSHAESVPPQAGPAVTLPAPPVVRPQVMAAPSQALAAGTDIPAVRDVPRPPARARTDTETTRSMSVDELLNALPPTAKPKLTPARGAPCGHHRRCRRRFLPSRRQTGPSGSKARFACCRITSGYRSCSFTSRR